MNYRNKYIKHIEDQGNFIEHYGCERCGTTNSFSFSVHHIYYKSEIPKHPELHNVRNMTWVCDKCHQYFHQKKSNRDGIVEERKLQELFVNKCPSYNPKTIEKISETFGRAINKL